MLRGERTFVCDDCHHKFTALDIEYIATSLSEPKKCPNRGSMHTMPYFPGSKFMERGVYKKLWRLAD